MGAFYLGQVSKLIPKRKRAEIVAAISSVRERKGEIARRRNVKMDSRLRHAGMTHD